MGYYFSGCCPVPTLIAAPPVTPVAVAFSYDTGEVFDTNSGGVLVFTGPNQSVNTTGYTQVTFTFSVDDIGFIIPIGSSVTSTGTSTSGTVTIPSQSLFLARNSGDLTGDTQSITITDGTHHVVITSADANPAAEITAAGFNIVASGATFPLSTLASWGMIDGSGNLKFKVCLIPFNGGRVAISGVALS